MAFGPITVQFRSFQNNYRLLKPSPIILKSSKLYSVFFSLLLWPGGGDSVMESMLSGPFVGDTRSLVASLPPFQPISWRQTDNPLDL